MKRAIGLLSASCLLAAAMVAGPLASSVQGEGVGVGDTPKIEFTALDGTKVNSKYLKDKLVVVDFWATWCGPCVAAMPHMKKIHEKYADDGVQILGISLDRSDAPLKKFIKERELPWPQVRSQAMAQKWGVRGIPSIFIISPEGEVLWNGHPMAMDEPLKKAMAEHLDTEADDDKPQEAEQLTEAQIKQANDALAAAATAAEEGDMETMLRKLEGISTEALASDEVKPNAKKLLESLIQNPKHREALKAAMEENREGALAFSNVARAALPRPARPAKAG
ncbi:MAG: TlpA family protein disulfide reductase, partial [Rhodospirillales bacterium]|nr:TlpA family protein disulfide reductase [Rhodospirillales bacterium]